jgi:hypothetical protein
MASPSTPESARFRDLVLQLDARGVVDELAANLGSSKAMYRQLQMTLAPLLFGPSAVIDGASSLKFLIECLRELLEPHAATMQPCIEQQSSESLPMARGGASGVAHLIIELVPTQPAACKAAGPPLDDDDAFRAACTLPAAALLKSCCSTPANARLASKVVTNFRLQLAGERSSQYPLPLC